jgi:two-component system, NtrC family, response regulator AtoC
MGAPSTVIDERRTRSPSSSSGGGGGHHLLVMGARVFERLPLPAQGTLTIGRAKDGDVYISDPLASRRHARLHVRAGPGWDIEDLESANGTRLRDERLAPGRPARVSPGEAIRIGSTILMVQADRALPAPPRVLGHGEFEGRVEWECARAEATGVAFAVVRLHLPGDPPADALAAAAGPALRALDLLGRYGPGEYELLLPGLDAAAASAAMGGLTRALGELGTAARVGVAAYPGDGVHAGALVAAACARVRAEDDGQAGAAADGGDLFDGLASQDEGVRRVYALAERAAAGTINVLVLGETGVGKEVLARWIHQRSARAGKAFLAVNCAALSGTLLESELFGHEKGAFTGAGAARAGLLESAPGGTLFLDEIGELPAALQAKLLRVLEAREVVRVGGVRPRPIDVRFVAATNRDIEADVARGEFRRDLYYRLNGMTLALPPLRERPGDLPALARLFLRALGRERKGGPPRLSGEALALLAAHGWPGNVRELRNVMERALLLCTGREILVEHLPADRLRPLTPAPAPAPAAGPTPPGGGDRLDRARVLAALAACGGNQSRAARQLGVSRKTLVARLDAYGITRPRKEPRR